MGKPLIPVDEAIRLRESGKSWKEIGIILAQPGFPPFQALSVMKAVKRYTTDKRYQRMRRMQQWLSNPNSQT
jgi:hypothetical protein